MQFYSQGERGFTRGQLFSKELVGVQYLRGFAVVLVVIHHLSSSGLEYLPIPEWGGFGVEIFFVISGFIMWHTTASSDVSVLGFWGRRMVRIVPLYWFFLCALVIVALSAPQDLNSTIITPENTIKSFFFIPHFHAIQKIIAPILIPGWSLNYEMFFYFLFGLALVVSSRLLRAVLVGVVLLGLVSLGLIFQPTGAVAETYTSYQLLKFFDGIILAMMYRSNLLKGPMLGLVLLSVGLLVRSIFVSRDFGQLESFVGLSPSLLVGGALALESVVRRATIAIFHAIGNASYSIYLSHLFFLRLSEVGWRHFVIFGSSKAVDVTYVAFSFAFAVAGGIVVYYIIERPILLLLRRRHSSVSPKTA